MCLLLLNKHLLRGNTWGMITSQWDFESESDGEGQGPDRDIRAQGEENNVLYACVYGVVMREGVRGAMRGRERGW